MKNCPSWLVLTARWGMPESSVISTIAPSISLPDAAVTIPTTILGSLGARGIWVLRGWAAEIFVAGGDLGIEGVAEKIMVSFGWDGGVTGDEEKTVAERPEGEGARRRAGGGGGGVVGVESFLIATDGLWITGLGVPADTGTGEDLRSALIVSIWVISSWSSSIFGEDVGGGSV